MKCFIFYWCYSDIFWHCTWWLTPSWCLGSVTVEILKVHWSTTGWGGAGGHPAADWHSDPAHPAEGDGRIVLHGSGRRQRTLQPDASPAQHRETGGMAGRRVPRWMNRQWNWVDWVSFLSAERSTQPDRQQPDVSARLFPAVQRARHLRSRQGGFHEVVDAGSEFPASSINLTAAVRFAPCTLATPSRCLTVSFFKHCKGLVNGCKAEDVVWFSVASNLLRLRYWILSSNTVKQISKLLPSGLASSLPSCLSFPVPFLLPPSGRADKGSMIYTKQTAFFILVREEVGRSFVRSSQSNQRRL